MLADFRFSVCDQPGIGSPMAPCEIHSREPGVDGVLATLHSTLSLGLGYVSSQGASLLHASDAFGCCAMIAARADNFDN